MQGNFAFVIASIVVIASIGTVSILTATPGAFGYSSSIENCTPGAFLFLRSPANNSVTSTSTILSCLTATSTMTSGQTCIVFGEASGLFVRVTTDSGVPVAGAEVDAVQNGPVINNVSCGLATINPLYTNSSGFVSMPAAGGRPLAGSFDITVRYSGHQYRTQVDLRPLTATYVFVKVPSGSVSLANCYYNQHCQVS